MLPKIAWCAVLCCAAMVQALPDAGRAQAVAGAPAADPFKDLPNVSFEYYPVQGTDEASISASLDQNAPRRPDGSKAMASTRYETAIQPYCMGSSKATATVKSTKVDLAAVVRLPKLADESQVPARLLAPWQRFVAALRLHEAGHVRIEYRRVRETGTTIVGSKCSDVPAKYAEGHARSATLQQAYDRETNSGLTQGAILRWSEMQAGG